MLLQVNWQTSPYEAPLQIPEIVRRGRAQVARGQAQQPGAGTVRVRGYCRCSRVGLAAGRHDAAAVLRAMYTEM